MLHYLIQWGHIYVIHFGVWVSFCCGASIYKNGMPELKDVPTMLKTALILAAVLSIFSSHSNHYLMNSLPKI
jgi:hypothetical protein